MTEIIYTKDGLKIDGIFQKMPMLKILHSKTGYNLEGTTPKGAVDITGFHNALMKNPEISKIRYEGINIPLSSQILTHWFFYVSRDNPKTSTKDFVKFFENQICKLPSPCGHQPKYGYEIWNELERIRLSYLLTIFRLIDKSENSQKDDMQAYGDLFDAIDYLSSDLFLEMNFILPGAGFLEPNHPEYFCKKCHRMREDPDRSKYCDYCQHEIRMEKQRERRGKTEIKKLEYCAGGCGKKLTGKQRVWCGDSQCWLKIYR